MRTYVRGDWNRINREGDPFHPPPGAPVAVIGLPFLAHGQQVPCMDNADLFNDAAEVRNIKSDKLKQARLLCATCPVVKECSDHALTVGESWGIWGGTTADQRNHMGSESQRATRLRLRREREQAARLQARLARESG